MIKNKRNSRSHFEIGKLKLAKSKRSVNLLAGTVIFVVLNVLFFSIMFFFIARAGSGASILEEVYAKRLAIVIDSMKPGTEIIFDASELYAAAKKNNFQQPIFDMNFTESSATIRVAKGEGYKFHYFTRLDYEGFSWNDKQETVTIKTAGIK